MVKEGESPSVYVIGVDRTSGHIRVSSLIRYVRIQVYSIVSPTDVLLSGVGFGVGSIK